MHDLVVVAIHMHEPRPLPVGITDNHVCAATELVGARSVGRNRPVESRRGPDSLASAKRFKFEIIMYIQRCMSAHVFENGFRPHRSRLIRLPSSGAVAAPPTCVSYIYQTPWCVVTTVARHVCAVFMCTTARRFVCMGGRGGRLHVDENLTDRIIWSG